MSTFVQRLSASCRANESLLCVGLDPDPSLMAIPDILKFNEGIIDATKDLVCAYKPNLAFYEAQGSRGILALEETVAYIRSSAPGVVLLADAKRGDIGSSNVHYARALFDFWGFDAATINAYAGRDSVQPFLDYEDRGVFVLCRSSNPGARDIQDLVVTPPGGDDPRPLYEWIALRASSWNDNGNMGLVVGATYPDELQRVRQLCPDIPILIPGVGAQFGQLEDSVRYGIDSGGRNAIFNVSRSVIYASHSKNDFQDAANREARALRDRINMDLEMQGKGWGHVATDAPEGAHELRKNT